MAGNAKNTAARKGKNTRPAALAVYFGSCGLGEIEDRGPGEVRAWHGIGAGRKLLGAFADRKAAMRAISAASKESAR